MPQQPSFLPWRPVLENVLLGSELAGIRDKEKGKKHTFDESWFRRIR